MAIETRIPSEVLDILKQSRITSDALYLPGIQLDRSLYEAVNKVIKNYGGKWHTGQKCHKFATDPREKFAAALGTGKTINEQQRDQSFFTPPELAAYVVSMAKVSGCNVLEPSAGRGALSKECLVHGARSVVSIEKNPDHAAKIPRECNPSCGDFLLMAPEAIYDRVVMNPPFSKSADAKHVQHALKFVKPGGRLVSILAAKPINWLPNLNHRVLALPEKSFKESGTNVNTQLLIVLV